MGGLVLLLLRNSGAACQALVEDVAYAHWRLPPAVSVLVVMLPIDSCAGNL